ncbi:MAG TPA: IS1595 family transposase, partial [Actinomycetota bacterium]
MSKSNRNDPKRSRASESKYSVFEFDREFPDDAACLDWLFRRRWPDGVFCPKDQRITKHHREHSRPSYACQFCGHRVHPMKGTIFEDSATSLRLWFHAMYLMASTRCGISAKQLEREIGVTYKTAWRMFNKIRSLLTQGEDPFSGTVEVDEAYYGGMGKWKHHQGRKRDLRADAYSQKQMMFGMAERGPRGARISATVADPKRDGIPLAGRVSKRVLPASVVFTDEALHYWRLGKSGYQHQRVNHSQNVYVSGDAHVNTVEGFWSLVKRG